MVGPAPSARLARRLVQDQALSPPCQTDCRRESREPGTDNVDGAYHQMKA